MKCITMLGLLLLAGCGMVKHKERMVKDSLFLKRKDLKLTVESGTNLSTRLLWDKADQQVLWITADAPFRWQTDSGLVADAGHFRIYSRYQGSTTLDGKQQLKSSSALHHQENEKNAELLNSVNKQVEIKDSGLWLWATGLLVLLLGIYWALKRTRMI